MPLKPDAALRKDRTTATDRAIFQHRHFAVIADIIRRMEKVNNQEHGFIDVREDVAEHFADWLASTNPNFDRSRFLAACRVED